MNFRHIISSGAVSGFFESYKGESTIQNEPEIPSQRSHHESPQPIHQEQFNLYPRPFLPPVYNSFYPYPLPFLPTMSYIDFLRTMSLEPELLSYLRKVEGLSNKNHSLECRRKTNNKRSQHTEQKQNECPFKDVAYNLSQRLCSTCERLRCSCCKKPLKTERPSSAPTDLNRPFCSCSQCLIPPHPLIYDHYFPVVSCICGHQIQREVKTRKKSKHKCNNPKSNQTSLQSDRADIPEREITIPPVKIEEITSKKSYLKKDSSSSKLAGNREEGYESDFKSEECGGIYTGEGDKCKTNKSESKKKEKRTRSPLAYFINV